LSYSTRAHASFDFIAPSYKQEEEQEESAQKEKKVNKVTASYYLEELVVDKVRDLADQKETSYSALVNDILKDSLRDITSES
jgi:predicted DNA-binding ribbon-helix-helix protein